MGKKTLIAIIESGRHLMNPTEELTDGEYSVIMQLLDWMRHSTFSSFQAVKPQNKKAVDVIVSNRLRYFIDDTQS